ncbi:MAG: TonB-dependent siderophore receptor [Burkholderiaceae bacterium]
MLMSGGPAFAQDAESAPAPAPAATEPAEAGASMLRPVEVDSQHLGTTTEFSGSYATGASTIGKSAQSLRETPQSVTVMTRQLLEDQNIRSLDDALRATPGILMQDNSSYERTYFSRGFEVDTVQYDGVPTLRRNGFAVSPDLAAYDRVEVLRGPAGLFNGAGSPGGTVNLVRKRPLKFRQFSAQLSAGSYQAYRGDLDLSMPINESGSLRARMAVAHEDRDFFYDRSHTKRSLFYGVVEGDLTPDTTLGLGLSYEKNDLVPMYAGLPRYTDGRDIGLPRSTNLNAGWAHTDITTQTIFVDLNHRFSNDWRAKISLTRMKEDNDDYSGSNYGAIDPATGMGSTMSAFHQHLLGEQKAADATLTGSFQAFGRKHDVLLGANYQKRDYGLASQMMEVPNAAYNVFEFDAADYAVFPTQPSRTRAPTSTRVRTEQQGLYGSLRFALSDPLKLIAGGRISRTENSTLNRVTGAYSIAPYKESSHFTPFAALTYDLNRTWTAYVSYAETFRSQSNQYTVSGAPLDPATGKNHELGLKGSHFGGRLNSSIALFHTIEDGRSLMAVSSPCPGSPLGGACYVNDGKVRSRGLDTELFGELLPGLQIAAGYTFNETRYMRDSTTNEGQPLSSFTPRHMLKIWSAYRLPGAGSAWTVGGGVNFQTKAYRISGNVRSEQGAYAVWSTRVTYRINRHLTAALNINNLFDKTYYQSLGTQVSGNWYGSPRSMTATLQAVF